MKNKFKNYCFLVILVMPIFGIAQSDITANTKNVLYSKFKVGLISMPFRKNSYLEKRKNQQYGRGEKQHFSVFIEYNFHRKYSLLGRVNFACQNLPKSIHNLNVDVLEFNPFSLEYIDRVEKTSFFESDPKHTDFSTEEFYLGKGLSVDLAYQKYFRERERGKADASFYFGLRGGKRQYISYHEDFEGSITQISNSNSGSWIDLSYPTRFNVKGQLHYSLRRGTYYFTSLIYGFNFGRDLSSIPLHFGLLISGQSPLVTSDELQSKFKRIVISLHGSIAYSF